MSQKEIQSTTKLGDFFLLHSAFTRQGNAYNAYQSFWFGGSIITITGQIERINVHKKIDCPIAPECLHQRRKIDFYSRFAGIVIGSIEPDTHHKEESHCRPCAMSELRLVNDCVKIPETSIANILAKSQCLQRTMKKPPTRQADSALYLGSQNIQASRAWALKKPHLTNLGQIDILCWYRPGCYRWAINFDTRRCCLPQVLLSDAS